MSIETALVFDRHGRTIRFFEPPGRTSGSIPDIRAKGDIGWGEREAKILWYFILEHKDIVGGVAHTHPWNGPATPSNTDVLTFRAFEQHAVGRLLLWPVATFSDVGYFGYNEITGMYVPCGPMTIEINGLEELRRRSGSNLRITA